jgi:hypothetical protein
MGFQGRLGMSAEACLTLDGFFCGFLEGLGFEPRGLEPPKCSECHGVALLPNVDSLMFVLALGFEFSAGFAPSM